MIHRRLLGTSKNAHIDNANNVISATRLDSRTVVVMPLFGDDRQYLVTRTGDNPIHVWSKERAVVVFLELMECDVELNYEYIAEGFI